MNLSAMGHWMQDAAVPFLMAMCAPPEGAAPSWVQFVPFALVLGIFYFVILLPMKKKQQKVDAFLGALKVGDRIITSGGIHGSITEISDQSVQIQIAEKERTQITTSATICQDGTGTLRDEGN